MNLRLLVLSFPILQASRLVFIKALGSEKVEILHPGTIVRFKISWQHQSSPYIVAMTRYYSTRKHAALTSTFISYLVCIQSYL